MARDPAPSAVPMPPHLVLKPPRPRRSKRSSQCTIYKNATDTVAWQFDKRFHTKPEDALAPKLIDLPPPWKPGAYRFTEGPSVTEDVHNAIVEMITRMNEAIRMLPDLSAAT